MTGIGNRPDPGLSIESRVLVALLDGEATVGTLANRVGVVRVKELHDHGSGVLPTLRAQGLVKFEHDPNGLLWRLSRRGNEEARRLRQRDVAASRTTTGGRVALNSSGTR